MRWTQSLIPTMKETPEGAEIPSHVLMLRAGLINQVMAGRLHVSAARAAGAEEGRADRPRGDGRGRGGRTAHAGDVAD